VGYAHSRFRVSTALGFDDLYDAVVAPSRRRRGARLAVLMESFLRLLTALLDAKIEVEAAHIHSVLFGAKGHRIEIEVANKDDIEKVMNAARNLGLEPVELSAGRGGAFVGHMVAVDVE
jgi:hypothetical protein